MITALVVDDDFRVARIHTAYVEQVEGFRVTGQAYTAAAALDAIKKDRPELILLDLYLPDIHGLELLRLLKRDAPEVDAIVLTAARDSASVRRALQLGVLHYLVEPFSADALHERLVAYAQLRARTQDPARELDQSDIDELYELLRARHQKPDRLPKGHSTATTAAILTALASAHDELTANAVAATVGVSRATAQRYLSSLVQTGRVQLSLRYGATGRPEHSYRLAAE